MQWSDPASSDKHYWHRYSGFYQQHLATLGPVSSILEFGVLQGASVRWLHTLFPDAAIIGVDILAPQPEWPTGPGISYATADQGDRAGIAAMLHALGRHFDLVIDDGSHVPQHQAICLAATMPFLRRGGMYILEDLHTSHPQHAYYQRHCAPGTPTSLHLLLLIEHLLATGRALSPAEAIRLSDPGLFSASDVQKLSNAIAAIDIHHRATLPLQCYACGADDLDPVALACRCGVSLDIISTDSITAVIRRRSN